MIITNSSKSLQGTLLLIITEANSNYQIGNKNHHTATLIPDAYEPLSSYRVSDALINNSRKGGPPGHNYQAISPEGIYPRRNLARMRLKRMTMQQPAPKYNNINILDEDI